MSKKKDEAAEAEEERWEEDRNAKESADEDMGVNIERIAAAQEQIVELLEDLVKLMRGQR